MQITSQVSRDFALPLALPAAYAALSDVLTCAQALPDVESIIDLGEHQYEWKLLPRKALNVQFSACYVTQYHFEDKLIHWHTISGNLQSEGKFVLQAASNGGVTVQVLMNQEVDLPVPAMLVPALQIFMNQQMLKGITAMMKQLANQATSLSAAA